MTRDGATGTVDGMDIDAAPHRSSHRSRAPLARDRLALAAVVWSLLVAALGLRWLLEPAAYPLGPVGSDQPTALLAVVPPATVSTVLLALGLLGVALVPALRGLRAGSRGRRVVLTTGAAYTVVFGVLVPDVQVLSFLGYALALAGPPVLVVVLVLGARRSPRNLVVLAAIALAVAGGVLAGAIGEPTLEMLRAIRDGAARVGSRPAVLALMVVGGALFAALTLAAGGHDPAPGSVRRAQRLQHRGRVATWVAAACPLPYALVRMTWLTPWPLGAPGGADALDGGVRVFGLLLGLAAVGGSVLTVGLVSRWGEVFPAWLPRLRGRPVPVLAAVVPAALVAVALCAASTSLVLMSVQADAPWLVLLIPAPLWGPALGLATLAYHRRRTQPAAAPPAPAPAPSDGVRAR